MGDEKKDIPKTFDVEAPVLAWARLRIALSQVKWQKDRRDHWDGGEMQEDPVFEHIEPPESMPDAMKLEHFEQRRTMPMRLRQLECARAALGKAIDENAIPSDKYTFRMMKALQMDPDDK